MDIAAEISGSFQQGYIPEAGLISGSSTSTGSFNHFLGKNLETSDIENKGMNVIPVEEYGKVYSTQNWDATVLYHQSVQMDMEIQDLVLFLNTIMIMELLDNYL